MKLERVGEWVLWERDSIIEAAVIKAREHFRRIKNETP